MNNLIEKAVRAMRGISYSEPCHWQDWEKEAKAAIAVVLKEVIKEFHDPDAGDALSIAQYIARENGVSLDDDR